MQKTALLGRGAFAPYKRFSEGKTLAQGQFTCPEHVKSRRVEPPVRRRNQKRRTRKSVSFFFGAGDEARTRYLHLGKVALYQMSYTCERQILLYRQSPEKSSNFFKDGYKSKIDETMLFAHCFSCINML